MRNKIAPICVTAFMLACGANAHARLYSYTDENGVMQFTDRLPPQYSDRGRTIYSEKGTKLKELAPPQTAEERAKEEELKRLREEQAKLVEEQKEADQRLLRSFPTADDIALARDGKIETVDVNIQVALNNIKHMKQRLLAMQEEVEAKQQQGKKISGSYNSEMTSLRQQIEDTYGKILGSEQQKEDIRNEYAHYLQRYRELKNLTEAGDGDDLIADESRKLEDLLETVVSCDSDAGCFGLWNRAVDYVKNNAQTPVRLTAPSLYLTAAPVRSDEISLTLSKIPRTQGDGYWIFLDLQCQAALTGGDRCSGEQADTIRDGFKPAVSGDAMPAAE